MNNRRVQGVMFEFIKNHSTIIVQIEKKIPWAFPFGLLLKVYDFAPKYSNQWGLL